MVYAIIQNVTISTRDRMLNSAVELIQERGASAVTVDAVLTHSHAPRGSVYHHFPGGRDEMVLAAVTRAGDNISTILQRSLATGDAADAVDGFIAFWKKAMRDSDFHAGCPVMAMAVDGRQDMPAAGEAVRRVFTGWLSEFEGHLIAQGWAPARARSIASMTIAAIEGGLVLSRATGSVRPLDDVAAELRVLLNSKEIS